MRERDYALPVRREREPKPEPGISLGEVLGMRYTAWLIGHASKAEVTVLEARRRVAVARGVTEEAEEDLQLRRDLRTLPFDQGRQVLGQETEMERLLLERAQIRQRRLTGWNPPPPSALPAPTEATVPVEWVIADRQIEALAVKAVTRFSALPPAEAERAWSTWRQELALRLPPYAAAEVARRAVELRDLAR